MVDYSFLFPSDDRPIIDCFTPLLFISGVKGKPVYRILFHLGRNDEIRKEYLSTGY